MESDKKSFDLTIPEVNNIYQSIIRAQQKGTLRVYLRNMELIAIADEENSSQLLESINRAKTYLESYFAPPQKVLEEIAVTAYFFIISDNLL